jgi:hypothetical protein
LIELGENQWKENPDLIEIDPGHLGPNPEKIKKEKNKSIKSYKRN